jgi:hypothetical protein
MLSIGMIALYAVALYVALGVVVGLSFVLFGASRALPEPIPLSVGARILIFPASVILWPIVLRRWHKAAHP